MAYDIPGRFDHLQIENFHHAISEETLKWYRGKQALGDPTVRYAL